MIHSWISRTFLLLMSFDIFVNSISSFQSLTSMHLFFWETFCFWDSLLTLFPGTISSTLIFAFFTIFADWLLVYYKSSSVSSQWTENLIWILKLYSFALSLTPLMLESFLVISFLPLFLDLKELSSLPFGSCYVWHYVLVLRLLLYPDFQYE